MRTDPAPRGSSEQLLACFAVRPELGSALFYGASGDRFLELVRDARALLSEVHGEIECAWLGPATTEEELWGTGYGLVPPWFRPGMVVTSSAQRLLIIADLASLSLAAARAAVVLMGAESGHVERSGQSLTFAPRLHWLAACPIEEIGRVSPHLLDRFAIRSTSAAEPQRLDDRLAEQRLARALTVEPSAQRVRSAPAAKPALDLRKVSQIRPEFPRSALAAVAGTFSAPRSPGMRREFSLAHTAAALAQLELSEAVSVAHVQRAAALLELAASERVSAAVVNLPASPVQPSPTANSSAVRGSAPQVPADSPLSADQPASQTSRLVEAVQGPAVPPPEVVAALAPLVLSASTLEREATVQRDPAPLQIPIAQGRAARRGRGPIIGVRPASTLEDLSLTATLFAAAPFQKVRRARAKSKRSGLLLAPSDLRAHRRALAAESLLVLLLDHTSLRDCDWGAALVPFLAAAYTARAQVAIVSVGAKGAPNELCAELLTAKNILAPVVAEALNRSPGRATPLAHGLWLALDLMQRTTNHGRAAIRRVTFVVVSDGRGNVPLAASRTGSLTVPILREGVSDALEQARQIGHEPRIDAVLLNPCPRLLSELPLAFSDRLGARVIEIASARSPAGTS